MVAGAPAVAAARVGTGVLTVLASKARQGLMFDRWAIDHIPLKIRIHRPRLTV